MSQGARLDTTVRVETPEGVELELHPVGLTARALAWSVDVLLRTGLLIGLSTALGLLGEAGVALVMVIAFALEWFYPVFCEVGFNGVTPGKKVLGIRVVRDDGAPIGLQASLVRNFLRAVDFLPLFNITGAVSIVLSGRFQRLGDLAAGTLVVYDARRREPSGISSDAPRPPPVQLKPLEQQLIVDFAGRRGTLSEARQEELAGYAGPLLRAGEAPATQLSAMAAWLAGDQAPEPATGSPQAAEPITGLAQAPPGSPP